MAESTTGVMHAAESSIHSPADGLAERSSEEGRSDRKPCLPEDIGINTASLLLEEIIKVENFDIGLNNQGFI